MTDIERELSDTRALYADGVRALQSAEGEIATLRRDLALAKADRDAARERADNLEDRWGEARAALAESDRRLTVVRTALEDIAAGRDVQCLVARLGEGAYECSVEAPCEACRARAALAAAEERAAQAERERDDALASARAWKRVADEADPEAQQKRAAIVEWLEAHPDEVTRSLSDATGRLEAERDEARAEVERLRVEREGLAGEWEQTIKDLSALRLSSDDAKAFRDGQEFALGECAKALRALATTPAQPAPQTEEM